MIIYKTCLAAAVCDILMTECMPASTTEQRKNLIFYLANYLPTYVYVPAYP